jgi:phosphotransferase system HPr (HPr) family protein
MQKFEYKVKDPDGLHARPAGLLVKCAQACSSNVNISKGGKSADAKRLFAVMGLNVKQNDEVTFSVEGQDERTDSAKLKAFCETNI